MTNVQNQFQGNSFVAYHGDCIPILGGLPSDSIHFSIFSPPYLSLYVYSSSDRDIGNARTDAEFWAHFGLVIPELLRVIMPGRIVAVDCMNVPAMKQRDGFIGLKDFRGDLIREFVGAGFIFHSEHCLWKDPLLEATRTKALGLMHQQLCKDSSMSRAGIPQYLLAFRKPGKNPAPIAHSKGLEWFVGEDPPTNGNLSHERWRRYASPVWTDIDFTRTLNRKGARENDDERHVCPMALDITDRALHLWSNPGETVLSPFMGIGSEGYCAIKAGRKFVGAELKASYFDQAVANLRAVDIVRQPSLFDSLATTQEASP